MMQTIDRCKRRPPSTVVEGDYSGSPVTREAELTEAPPSPSQKTFQQQPSLSREAATTPKPTSYFVESPVSVIGSGCSSDSPSHSEVPLPGPGVVAVGCEPEELEPSDNESESKCVLPERDLMLLDDSFVYLLEATLRTEDALLSKAMSSNFRARDIADVNLSGNCSEDFAAIDQEVLSMASFNEGNVDNGVQGLEPAVTCCMNRSCRGMLEAQERRAAAGEGEYDLMNLLAREMGGIDALKHLDVSATSLEAFLQALDGAIEGSVDMIPTDSEDFNKTAPSERR